MNGSERWDDLQLGGVGIYQDSNCFCFGVDAVLLADFCRAAKGERVLDLCSGNGIIPILLAAKTQMSHALGLELAERSCELFEKSIARNGQQDRVSVCCGDVRSARSLLTNGSFSLVTCNPPYLEAGRGLQNATDELCWARHEVKCTLSEVLDAAAWAVKFGGRVCMIHRPHRMEDLLFLMRQKKLEPKRLRPVYPKPGEKAAMILVEAVAGGKPGMILEPPLTICSCDGSYTEEIDRIYARVGSGGEQR